MDNPNDRQEDFITAGAVVGQLLNRKRLTEPSQLTSFLVTWGVTSYAVLCLIEALVISLMDFSQWYTIFLAVVFGGMLIFILYSISIQPRSGKELSFTVPLVPWLPGLSIMINIYLMTQLDVATWVRFLVWIIVGLAIYFGYGIFHSKMRYSHLQESKSPSEIGQSSETITSMVDKKDVNI